MSATPHVTTDGEDFQADLTELDAGVASSQDATRDVQPDRMTSVAKALVLLSAFRGISPPIGVSELARRADLPKSTAFRLLADLERAGFVERDGADYRLGLTLFELGSRVKFCRPNGLRDTAMHHMSSLHVQTGLDVHLGVMEGSDVIHLSKINHGRQTLQRHHQPGTHIPATCSALGKAILAFSSPEAIRAVLDAKLPARTRYSITEPSRLIRELSRAREEGIAYEHEESSIGVGAMAAPIRLEGLAVGAVSVSFTPPLSNAKRVVVQVRNSAQQISSEHEAWSDSIW